MSDKINQNSKIKNQNENLKCKMKLNRSIVKLLNCYGQLVRREVINSPPQFKNLAIYFSFCIFSFSFCILTFDFCIIIHPLLRHNNILNNSNQIPLLSRTKFYYSTSFSWKIPSPIFKYFLASEVTTLPRGVLSKKPNFIKYGS